MKPQHDENNSKKNKKKGKNKSNSSIHTIWLPICDDKNKVNAMLPLSPKSNPLSMEEWVIRDDMKVDFNNNNSNSNNDTSSKLSDLIAYCLDDILGIVLEDQGWILKPIERIEDANLISKEIIKFQSNKFVKLEEGFWIHLDYESHARSMYKANNETELQSKLDLILKSTQESLINTRIIINDISEIKDSLSTLTKIVKNLNIRNTPTTFLLMDHSSIEQSKKVLNDPSRGADVTRKECLKSGIKRLGGLFESVSKFVADPLEETKNLIVDKLHDKMYLYLTCECCFQPQQDDSVWPVVISSPKEVVPKILPLAKAGILAARGLNMGLQIGKCFGFPLPSIDDKNFSDASEFLKGLEDSTLDDYDKLQDLVSKHWGSTSDHNDKKNDNTPLNSNEDNFAIKEFERFLLSDKCDPNKTFERLLQVTITNSGDKLYICRDCERKRVSETK